MLFLLPRKFEGVESLNGGSALFSGGVIGSKIFRTCDRKQGVSIMNITLLDNGWTSAGKWSQQPSLPSSRLACCRAAGPLCCCSSGCCWWTFPAGANWWPLPAYDWMWPDRRCWGAVHWGSKSAVCPTAETPAAAPRTWKRQTFFKKNKKLPV